MWGVEYKRLYGLTLDEKGLKNDTPVEVSIGTEDVQVLTSMFKKHKSDKWRREQVGVREIP